MSDPADIAADLTCWQCGAPADPTAVLVRRLSRRRSLAPDGQGFAVTTGWASDVVRVPIPRCRRCAVRDLMVGATTTIAVLAGAVAGGSAFRSNGWTTIAGAAAVIFPVLLALRLYRRVAGLQAIDAYPPLRALRRAGWSDPV